MRIQCGHVQSGFNPVGCYAMKSGHSYRRVDSLVISVSQLVSVIQVVKSPSTVLVQLCALEVHHCNQCHNLCPIHENIHNYFAQAQTVVTGLFFLPLQVKVTSLSNYSQSKHVYAQSVYIN